MHVALDLDHPPDRVKKFEIACLLHDIGRAGLEPTLFGKIWSWAKQQGIPTRPREWRAQYPNTPYGKETQAFIKKFKEDLQAQGLTFSPRVRDHVEMRLGFARRLKKQITRIKPQVYDLGLPWEPWMGTIMLYYYYPEKLERSAPWVHQLGEILVACEQLEAYSNHRRGQDYYARSRETFKSAFSYLQTLTSSCIVSQDVFDSICRLTKAGCFTTTLRQARGGKLSKSDERFLRTLPINHLRPVAQR